MMQGDVVNHLHHDNGFTTTGTTEQSHLTTHWEWNEKVNYFDTCCKNTNFSIKVCEIRS